jgi:hypothetical protein
MKHILRVAFLALWSLTLAGIASIASLGLTLVYQHQVPGWAQGIGYAIGVVGFSLGLAWILFDVYNWLRHRMKLM